MEHFNITFKPDDRRVSIHAGATLFDAASQAGIILNSVCGGQGTCKKCLVNIEPGNLQVPACQHKIQSDLVVTVPPQSRFFDEKILTHGIDIETRIAVENDTKLTYGLTVDIGTTTVVAKLLYMRNGKILATRAVLNPQIRYGDDCISRISYAQTDAKLLQLHRLIIECINTLILQLCSDASIKPDQIHRMTVVGNATMNHIFLKLPLKSLGQAPYKAFSLEPSDSSAKKLKIRVNPAAQIYTLANIAGFVGSDTTAVALAVDIDSAEKPTLVVDIGTNGEIVLAAKGKLYAASCAAGPALEGARISSGGRAADGAIESVFITDGDIDFDVIGNTPPHCICGSGLIDAVAVLLELGIVDSTGRFTEPKKLQSELPEAIFSRITKQDKQPAFCLADSERTAAQPIYITQRDIRQLQLAKAAIRAGTTLLLRKASQQEADIEKIHLAGAFGNYIRRESAIRIGLLPSIPPQRIHFVGNAASSGAQMALLNDSIRNFAAELAKKIQYVEIANEPDFTDIYTECMSF